MTAQDERDRVFDLVRGEIWKNVSGPVEVLGDRLRTELSQLTADHADRADRTERGSMWSGVGI